MPTILVTFLVGVVLVLFGIGRSIFSKKFDKGVWYSGIGTVFTVLSLLLVAGYNDTAYYPSAVDLQSSLTLANSSSSLFNAENHGIRFHSGAVCVGLYLLYMAKHR